AGRRRQTRTSIADHPRAGRRQRGGRAYAAAFRCAAGGRPAAQRAAAVRRHAYDAPGRSGREPAAAPGGLPAPRAGRLASTAAESLLTLQADFLHKRLAVPGLTVIETGS